MSGKVVKFPKRKPKVRPLRATYSNTTPYVVERHDEEDGEIVYEVWDRRPSSYRRVSRHADGFADDVSGGNPYAKHDADQVARALNLLVQCGKEILPNVREED